MLEDHPQSPVTRRSLRSGPSADHVDQFADWLQDRGYRPVTIDQKLCSLAGWTDWLTPAGFSLDEAVPALASCEVFVARAGRVLLERGPNEASLAVARCFIRFLWESGVLPSPERHPSPSETWPLLAEFRGWTREQRGLRESSLDTYEVVLVDLLRSLGDTLRQDRFRTLVRGRAAVARCGSAAMLTSDVKAPVSKELGWEPEEPGLRKPPLRAPTLARLRLKWQSSFADLRADETCLPGYIPLMAWDIGYTDEFGQWRDALSEAEQESVDAHVTLLEKKKRADVAFSL
jgi:hypothetical protein